MAISAQDCYDAGWKARHAGEARNRNPMQWRSETAGLAAWWSTGWDEAEESIKAAQSAAQSDQQK